MTDTNPPHDPKSPKKVLCQRLWSERHTVDPRIAFLVQSLLDHGLELCGAEMHDNDVELAFYESDTLNWFYDLAVPAEPSNALYQKAIGDAKPDDANWWTHVMMVPPNPSEEIDGFDLVLTLVFPYSDYDEVLRNVRSRGIGGESAED